jgi:hypothetical protein
MPKVDFDFYKIPGLEGDFVVPAIDCDPYHGQHDLSKVGQIAVQLIAEAVEENLGSAPEIEDRTAEADEMAEYLFNMIPEGTETARQVIKMTAPLKVEGDSYYSLPMNALLRALGPVCRQIPVTYPPASGREDVGSIKVVRDGGGPEFFNALYGQDEEPVNPNITLRQLIPVRAFRWLPGPERESASKQTLPPTYSPRPVAVTIAQRIEIVGLNPLVQESF